MTIVIRLYNSRYWRVSGEMAINSPGKIAWWFRASTGDNNLDDGMQRLFDWLREYGLGCEIEFRRL